MKRHNATNINADAAENNDCGRMSGRLRGLKRWMVARFEAHLRRTTALGVHRRSRY